jgi:hypothetical protein
MSKHTRLPDSVASGGLKVTDEKAIKEQRGVVWDLIKQLGQSLTQGASLTRIAVPVHIAEPRSYLERIVDGWCYAPIYLKRAAEEEDPLERLKLVITFAIAGLSNTVTAKKPFNPILGETFEAQFEDGTDIFCEQTSHHPPVTNWNIEGPNNSYNFYGYGEWCASFRGNSIKGEQKGMHYVDFNDGTQIQYELPACWARGIMWGDRIIEYDGEMLFVDKKNKLVAEIKFNPDGGGWFSSWRKKSPTDCFTGTIYAVKNIDDKPDKGKKKSEVSGSWLGWIEFYGKVYWEWDQELQKYMPLQVDNPLPSDCRFRQDINLLKLEDFEAAGEFKHEYEEVQRRDARLRKEYQESLEFEED